MTEKKRIIIGVQEELIIKVAMPDYIAKEFLKLICGITTGENFERIGNDGPSYLVVKISPGQRSQFYNLLSEFCKEYNLPFKKP